MTVNPHQLSDEEHSALAALQQARIISEAQATEALETHRLHRTPLRDILGAMGVDQKHYAGALAEVARTGYMSDLVDSEYFDYDPDFLRRFDPAVMMRYLFCPLRQAEGV